MQRSLLFAFQCQKMLFSQETFHQLFSFGWIVDGRDGGFVLGRRHAAGNIYMICAVENKFTFHGNLEGGEYILNHRASQHHMERLKELNSVRTVDDAMLTTLDISSSTRILNLHAEPFDKLLLIDSRGQFIVNRSSSRMYFSELEAMNESVSDFRSCAPDELVPKENAQQDAEGNSRCAGQLGDQ